MTVLTGDVKSSAAGPILDEHIGAALTEEGRGPAETPGGGQVEGGVHVQLVLVIQPGPGHHQHPGRVQVASATSQVESRAPGLRVNQVLH